MHAVLPYLSLRAPNVNGTLCIIKLALQAAACIHYVSTLSVFDGCNGAVAEDTPIVDNIQIVPYFSGYGQSVRIYSLF